MRCACLGLRTALAMPARQDAVASDDKPAASLSAALISGEVRGCMSE